MASDRSTTAFSSSSVMSLSSYDDSSSEEMNTLSSIASIGGRGVAEIGFDFLAEDFGAYWPLRRKGNFDWRKLLAAGQPGDDKLRRLSFASSFVDLIGVGCVAEMEANAKAEFRSIAEACTLTF